MQAAISLRAQLQMFSRTGVLHSLGLQLLAVTSVLMIAALILMSVTLSNLQNSQQQTEVTTDTFLEITTIESRLLSNDGALKGYALTGNPIFLKVFARSQGQLQDAMRKLSRSIGGDPIQFQRYEAIVSLVKKREALDAYLAQPEHRAALSDISATKSSAFLNRTIRGRLWKILTDERIKRRDAYTAMVSQARQSFWVAVGVVVLTLLFGGLCIAVASPPKAA